jgi:hypothetical protein
MSNIKTLLREELLYNDKKNLLSAESLALINNTNHVRYVLGIDTQLNENISLETRKLILEAQFGLDKMLNSITNYVGNAVEKGKEKVVSVIDDVSNLKDIALLIKDLIISPELMKTAIDSLKRVANTIISELKNFITKITGALLKFSPNILEKIKKFIEHIIDVLSGLISGNGWMGFLKILGFCCLIKFLTKGVFDKLKNFSEEEIIKYFGGMVDIMNKFKEFATSIIERLDIQPILNWFSKISGGSILGPLLAGISIITILNEVLTPVIKSVDWGKKLVKK